MDSPPQPLRPGLSLKLSVRPPRRTPHQTQICGWTHHPFIQMHLPHLSCHIVSEDWPPCQRHTPILLEHLEAPHPNLASEAPAGKTGEVRGGHEGCSSRR